MEPQADCSASNSCQPVVFDTQQRSRGVWAASRATLATLALSAPLFQHDELYTVRTVFVVDPKKIRLTITYPQTAGRNFDEILRVIDSPQLTDAHSVSTPVNWKSGDDVIILPSVSDADANPRFSRGRKALKPYLRLTPDPSR